MSDLLDILRDRIRNLRVAFDRRWARFRGLTSPERAVRIVWGTRGPLELEGVERISLGAVAVLARHDDDLRLPSLRELNPELARILAQHRHRLYLDGCTSIDGDTAKALAVHGFETVRRSCEESFKAWRILKAIPSPGDEDWEPGHELDAMDAILTGPGYVETLTLSLSGLRDLPPLVARMLGTHKGTLILKGLEALSDEAAQLLGNHFGSLELNGLRSLSPAAARGLVYAGGRQPVYLMLDMRLCLNRLRDISIETARELARYRNTLSLGGLRELSADMAEALSAFSPESRFDRLELNRLRELTPEAADVLPVS